jgi:DNA-binding NtrC family response regulator
VVFDCGAMPALLAQSELFGHERGAFTGAVRARAGLVEEADGGTLFLDEIGELPLELQPLLLGLLERRSFRRVGASEPRSVDLRIIAATHRNLDELVRSGTFRQDLLFRLAVLRLKVPPLRERPEDVPVLASEFAREAGATLTPELVGLLQSHPWPGNVRELRNTITQLAVHGEPPELAPRADARSARVAPLQDARRLAADQFERDYLERLLLAVEGNVTRGAEVAGVSRQLLTRMLAKHGLRGRDREGTGGR